MKKKKREYSVACEKLVGSCFLLSRRGLFASKEGLYYFLKGVSDFGSFEDMPLFGSLLSMQKKRFGANLNLLLEKGLLQQFSVEGKKEEYFRLTEEGEKVAESFLERYFSSKAEEKKVSAKTRFIPIEEIERK